MRMRAGVPALEPIDSKAGETGVFGTAATSLLMLTRTAEGP